MANASSVPVSTSSRIGRGMAPTLEAGPTNSRGPRPRRRRAACQGSRKPVPSSRPSPGCRQCRRATRPAGPSASLDLPPVDLVRRSARRDVGVGGGSIPRRAAPAPWSARGRDGRRRQSSAGRDAAAGAAPPVPVAHRGVHRLGRARHASSTHRLTLPRRTGLACAPAPIAQGIEQGFPKPCVAGSNPAGGARI